VKARRLVVPALLVALVAACGDAGAGSAHGGSVASSVTALEPVLPVTVASDDGREVTVHDVSRIVPLVGSISEVIFALGLGGNVVGRDISATFAEAAHLPLVTRAHDVSAESVLSLRPTLVLADPDTGPPEALEHLRNVGVPVLVIEKADRVDEIGPRLLAIATALGVPAAGERLVAATQDELDAVRAAVASGGDRPPRIAFLYLRGQAGVYLLGGPGAGTDSVIDAIGGEDAGTAIGLERPFTPLTSEALVKAAPDVLLLTTTGLESVGGIEGLLQITGVAQTPAGRDRRVITLEDGLLFSFGSRTPEALRSLAAQLTRGEP
jgi:iron complex transport system substrate-binding protein